MSELYDRLGYLLKHAQIGLSGHTGPALARLRVDGRELAVLTVLSEASGPDGRDSEVAGPDGRDSEVAGLEERGPAVAGSEGRGLEAAGSDGRGPAIAGSEGRDLEVAGSDGRGPAVAGADGRDSGAVGSGGGDSGVAGVGGHDSAGAGSGGRGSAGGGLGEAPVLARRGSGASGGSGGREVAGGRRRSPALAQHEAAEKLGVDRTTMVELIDGLEGKGLVRRRPDPADRRRKLVHLTDQGRATVSDGGRAVREAEQAFLAALTPAEADQLRALLRRAIGAPVRLDSDISG